MKKISYLPLGVRSLGRTPAVYTFLLRSLALVLGGVALAGSRVAAADDPDAYRINVRSFVERPYSLFSKKPPREHSKLYAISGIKNSNALWKDASDPMVVPVDEAQVLEQLRGALAARGFHEASNDVPDIVLTVFYGVGQLKNIYADKNMDVTGGDIGIGSTKVVNTSAEQMLRERSEPGYSDKMQRAAEEKLFIIVNAWEFPGFNPHAKKKLLWRTIVSVDDPHRDLNVSAAKMFAAAGSYFDHETPTEEVTVMSDVPEGKTSIGPMIDLGPTKAVK